MNARHTALIDVIEHFKKDGMSTLEAALNVIENHAETIKEQHDEIERLRALISEACEASKPIGRV